MGQLGMWEIVAIFLVALLVFGPKKLPELGKSLGKGLREFKRATNDLKSSWEDQVRDIDREVSSATREVRKAGRDLEKDVQNSIKGEAVPSKDSAVPKASGKPAAAAEATVSSREPERSRPVPPPVGTEDKPAEETSEKPS